MANKKIPMRKCVGCQEMKEKKSLIRVVKTAEGDIILDDTGKKLCCCKDTSEECQMRSRTDRSSRRIG